MVLFWIIVFIMALCAVAFIAHPIINAVAAGHDEPLSNGEGEISARLADIESDAEFGLINGDEIAAAQAEARAAVENAREVSARTEATSRPGRFAALVALGAAPLGAVLLYLYLGSPQALNAGADLNGARAQLAQGNAQLTALEQQAQRAPDDFDNWIALGDAYVSANQPDGAVRAFSRAIELRADDANAHSAYGEALVQQANGAIIGEARGAFERALELAPGDPRAQYYLGEARFQVGAVEDAVRRWAALLNDAPPNAPWFGAVAARMNDVAAQSGVSLNEAGLSEAALQRLAAANVGAPATPEMSFDAAIGRIHDGTASFQDWMLAAATYQERGEIDRATDILGRAETRFANAPFVLGQIKNAQAQLEAGELIAQPSTGSPGGVRGPSAEQAGAIAALPADEQRQMIEGMVSGLAARLEAEPDNPAGWRMLGRSYRVLGRPEDSAAAWREFLARSQGDAEDWRQYAFALIDMRTEGDNAVSPELADALENLRRFNVDDPLALYHLGHAARNRGDDEEALALWTRLRETLPAETPLAATLNQLIDDVD